MKANCLSYGNMQINATTYDSSTLSTPKAAFKGKADKTIKKLVNLVKWLEESLQIERAHSKELYEKTKQ